MNRTDKHLAWPLMLTVLVLVTACGGDDPTDPDGGVPGPEFWPESPDSLVALYQQALVEMDTLLYPQLLDDGFRYWFEPADVEANELTTDYLIRTEARLAAANMFSGKDIINGEGRLVPAVARFIVYEFSKQGEWATAGDDSPFPGTQVCRHTVRINVERGFGGETMIIFGDLDVHVSSELRDAGPLGEREIFLLAGLVGAGPGTAETAHRKIENFSWGMAHYTYLTNEAPLPALSTRLLGTFPLAGFELDARGSGDQDSGLHPNPYRWRRSATADWTGWRNSPLFRFEFSEPDTVLAGLQVRDRWGVTALQEVSLEIPAAELPFPDSPEVLLTNFRTVYDNMIFSLFSDLLDPGFELFLSEAIQLAYPDLGPTVDFGEEIAITERLFSGEEVVNPDEETVPGVSVISFETMARVGDWGPSLPEDPIQGAEAATYDISVLLLRPGATTLAVEGQLRFFVAGRDSLHDEVQQTFYQIVGQQDLTSETKALESVSWGRLRGLYR